MMTSKAPCQSSSTLVNPAFRSPRRITVTVPYGAYQLLMERSTQEGRSLSNLAAFLLESGLGAATLNGTGLQ